MKSYHITSYQILRHGVEHSDYFQGCGTAFTDYDHVVTGIGDTEKEAFEDALNQLCECHSPDEGSDRRLAWDSENTDWDTETIQDRLGMSDDEMSMAFDTPYWHVSIRYNAEERHEEIPA